MHNTHIDVSQHTCSFSSYIHPKYGEQRICLYLRRENDKFVDSLDIDYTTGRVRFYGSAKDYSLNKIPECKKKLWNCKNFRKMIIEKLVDTELFKARELNSELYSISLNSINNCTI